ncbi:ArsR/SmtB family transcription factor [Streptomyces incanus]|uniref:ArsR/SmtB family transcription factor n=1 Tax=Streptomyces incanus TaxID=887453 RepID=A0ABW0XDF9_9ACTN
MQDHASSPAESGATLPCALGALGDPTRLGTVRGLYGGEERGGGRLRAPVAKSALGHHLKVPREAGITRNRQEGTRCFVALRRDSLDARFPGLLSAAVAEHVGGHVTETRDED